MSPSLGSEEWYTGSLEYTDNKDCFITVFSSRFYGGRLLSSDMMKAKSMICTCVLVIGIVIGQAQKPVPARQAEFRAATEAFDHPKPCQLTGQSVLSG
ncbi:uncharacterized protein LOC144097417 isoform X2 [Amblyomma americanum]